MENAKSKKDACAQAAALQAANARIHVLPERVE